MSTLGRLARLGRFGLAVWQLIARLALTLAGFTLCTAAAWHTFGLGAGLLVAGAACLVLELVIKDDAQSARHGRGPS